MLPRCQGKIKTEGLSHNGRDQDTGQLMESVILDWVPDQGKDVTENWGNANTSLE